MSVSRAPRDTAATPRKSVRSVLSWLAGVAGVGVGLGWVVHHWHQLSTGVEIDGFDLAAIGGLMTVSLVVIGATNQVIVSHLGVQLRARQWIALPYAVSFLNLMLPMRGGTVLRALYLRRRFALPVSRTVVCVVAVQAIQIVVSSAAGLGAALHRSWVGPATPGMVPVMAVFGACLGLAVIGYLFGRRTRVRPEDADPARWPGLVRTTVRTLLGARPLLTRGFVLTILLLGLDAVRVQLSFDAVGHSISLRDALLISSLTSIALVASLTPAGLGVREAMVTVGTLAAGGPAEIGLLAALVDRAVTTAVIALAGPIALRRILLDMKAGGTA